MSGTAPEDAVPPARKLGGMSARCRCVSEDETARLPVATTRLTHRGGALSDQRGMRYQARHAQQVRALPPSPFRRFNSSPEVIRLVVMMYVRFPLSLRNVEDLLFERGIDICHETVRM